MRIVRFGEPGRERPGVLTPEGRLLDATSLVADWTAEHLDPSSLAAVSESLDKLPEVDPERVRLGAPIARPGKIVCIGLNYADHAAESGATIPDEPVVFMKDPSTVVGPHDLVLVPRGSQKTDFEVELAVIVGRQIRYAASAAEALACVAGYATSNDLSEREFQLERGGQWDKGKSCETFNPLGPWMVTADELPDPQALALELWVNGRNMQSSTTAEMVFGVGEILRYLSQFMVLRPGDLVNTGTPAGVALGQPDLPYLREGDVVECSISGLGTQRVLVGQA
jgi:2-keto-4-pentenoate hydratase/2-oxohepta-3-ene-1,7-dioic acid hydratase in catechol pathway